MAAILIVAHAPLASALQAVAAHAFPERRADVGALDVSPDMLDPQAALAETAERLGGGELLVLTDAFGATPCNLAQRLAERDPKVRVVAGVNVPMLWRALCYSEAPLDELVGRAVAGATQGVMHATSTPRQNQPSRPLAHDLLPHHDQQ